MDSIKPCQDCGKDLTSGTVQVIDWRRVCGDCFQKRSSMRGQEGLQQ